MITKTMGMFKTIRPFFLLLACFGLMWFVRFHVNQPITGDEPHYLLMDYSIIHDHDLNLKNNYENQDYRKFYPAPIDPIPQIGRGQAQTDKWYSIHGIGLPLLLLPGMLLAGPKGAAITMVLVSVAVVWLTWYWVALITKNKRLALASAIVLISCYFFSGLSGYLYPDMVIAGLTLASLIIIEKYYSNSVLQIMFGVIMGFLVILHLKTLALVVPLTIALTYKTWREQRKIPWLTFAALLPLAICFAYLTHHWYGVYNPASIYPPAINLKASPTHIITAILFDSKRGLTINNPAVLLLFLGLPIWLKTRRESCLITIFTLLPSAMLLAVFNQWQGGYSPVGRYIIDFLPVLMPAAAFAISQIKFFYQKAITVLLVLINLLITLDFVIIKRLYVRDELHSPLFVQLHQHLGLNLDHFLPTFSNVTTLTYKSGLAGIIIGYCILTVTIVYGYYVSRFTPEPKMPSHKLPVN